MASKKYPMICRSFIPQRVSPYNFFKPVKNTSKKFSAYNFIDFFFNFKYNQQNSSPENEKVLNQYF